MQGMPKLKFQVKRLFDSCLCQLSHVSTIFSCVRTAARTSGGPHVRGDDVECLLDWKALQRLGMRRRCQNSLPALWARAVVSRWV